MPIPIVIDTDPGQDDAAAILLALGSPELELLAITTVAGNVELDLATGNALRLLELAGRPDIPVHAGCPRPMVRALVTAKHVHGRTGLDGADLPEPRIAARAQHAVPFLVETLRNSARKVTLCPIGPLTNIALALIGAPDIAARIERIVLMGGAFSGGNVTPAAEFNIHVDPHAAHVVLTSGVPIAMMPLDVTHQNQTTPARLAEIAAIGTAPARAMAGMLSFYDRAHAKRFGGPPLHDPTTIAWLIRPELFEGVAAHVKVEHASETTMGATIGDLHGKTGERPNAEVMLRIDADGFQRLFVERLARL
jgi:purine nucleosidase